MLCNPSSRSRLLSTSSIVTPLNKPEPIQEEYYESEPEPDEPMNDQFVVYRAPESRYLPCEKLMRKLHKDKKDKEKKHKQKKSKNNHTTERTHLNPDEINNISDSISGIMNDLTI